MNQKGLTILMVLHDLNHAVAYSEKVMMLKKTKMISFGSIDSVFNEENLSKVFDINIKLIADKRVSKPVVVSSK